MPPKVNLVLDGEFYPRFKARRSAYSQDTFDCAEKTVRDLLEHSTTAEHPGMLLGKVQSGKTRTYVSALALAFDNGFDIAVILSKNSKALIQQTKKRLEDEFSEFVNDESLDVYDIMEAPESFSKFELEAKLIFVVKKQKDNLNRLEELIRNGCPEMASQRTLVIDDEADNASVGYSKKDDEIEANTIAGQVSDLRNLIETVSFLQVTATPYSLYLQPTDIAVSNRSTFSPTRPCFTNLVPVPNDYVGGDVYFGDQARSDTPTVESLIHVSVSDRELAVLKKSDGRRLKIDDALVSSAIEGLRTAFVTFVTGGCIQRINGISAGADSRKLRYSFLMHSEPSRESHSWQELVVTKLAENFQAEAEAHSDLFKELVLAAYTDLSQSLKLNGDPVPSFDNVLDQVRTAMSGGYLTISKVNSDEQIISMLDNSGQLKLRSPLHIFIGGQVLDRGVTLANLIGFYYGRRPQKFQQDTVLQHSRMYGYRRKDLGVTRFYTSYYIRSAMFEMEQFDSALRDAIQAGGDRGVQFIRTASNGRVTPCSPNKILVATTQTLRPGRRLLPIGFQSGYKTHIKAAIEKTDSLIEASCGFNSKKPSLVDISLAYELLETIRPTLEFDDEDVRPFDWEAAKAAIAHLSQQHPDEKQRGKILLWAARDRKSARFASESSHAKYIETPDSEKTEGQIAKQHAIDHPILYMLRQNGDEEKDWRGTPFYWPVIRAQKNAPTAIYTVETLDD